MLAEQRRTAYGCPRHCREVQWRAGHAVDADPGLLDVLPHLVGQARVVLDELAEGLVGTPRDAGAVERRADLGEVARLEPWAQDRRDQVAVSKAAGLGADVDVGCLADLVHLHVRAGDVEQGGHWRSVKATTITCRSSRVMKSWPNAP